MRLFWKAACLTICIMVGAVILKSLILAVFAVGMIVPFVWFMLYLGEKYAMKGD